MSLMPRHCHRCLDYSQSAFMTEEILGRCAGLLETIMAKAPKNVSLAHRRVLKIAEILKMDPSKRVEKFTEVTAQFEEEDG